MNASAATAIIASAPVQLGMRKMITSAIADTAIDTVNK